MPGISLSLATLAFFTGIVVSLGVLSGDAEGRVNLLYLLVLFAILPALGLFLSLVFMLRRRSRGLAGWVLELPWWPRHWRRYLVNLHVNPQDRQLRKLWLFYQTQVLALGLGIGALSAFFILLLGTDVSFVWRSTLLEAGDLLPVLRALALPWIFWTEAQPTLELLQLSQDFRLAEQEHTSQALGQWWAYAFAALATYNLLPRTVLLLVARLYYVSRLRNASHSAPAAFASVSAVNTVSEPGAHAPVVDAVSSPYHLIDWALAPQFLTDRLAAIFGQPEQIYRPDTTADARPDEFHRFRDDGDIVVLVKSWEAPLGELRDYLESLRSATGKPVVLLPLDWDEQDIRRIVDVHLDEWRRFGACLPGSKILQPALPDGSETQA